MRLILVFLVVFNSIWASAQICEPARLIYFNSAKHATDRLQEIGLSALVDSMDENSTYFIELYGHTDEEGDEDLNYKLALRRTAHVKEYLEKNFKGEIHKIEEISKGETDPVKNSTVKNYQAFNRRVEVMLFKMENGKIVLKGERGIELKVDTDYFSPCSICDSKPNLQEAFDEEQAAELGMTLETTDGEQLITGGMFSFDHICEEAKDKPCMSMEVYVPSNDVNPAMTLWDGVRENGSVRWEASDDSLQRDGGYFFTVNSCSWPLLLNCDAPRYAEKLFELRSDYDLTPKKSGYMRLSNSEGNISFGINEKIEEEDTVLEFGHPNIEEVIFKHISIEDGIEHIFYGEIADYEKDTLGVSGVYLNRELYDSRALMSDTTAMIRIKSKWWSDVTVIVPETGETWTPTKSGGICEKLTFKLPIPETELILKDGEKEKIIELKDVKTRYKKRKKVLKFKIKRRDLKNKK